MAHTKPMTQITDELLAVNCATLGQEIDGLVQPLDRRKGAPPMKQESRRLLYEAIRLDGTACAVCNQNVRGFESHTTQCHAVKTGLYENCPVVERTIVTTFNFAQAFPSHARRPDTPLPTAPTEVSAVDPLADVPLNNLFFVGVNDEGMLQVARPAVLLNQADAANLAAWLLIMSDNHVHFDSFRKLVELIMETDRGQ